MEIDNFKYLESEFTKVVVIAGENGAGKSRYLRKVAEHFSQLGRPVVLVCNTIYDRFLGLKGVPKFSVSQGRNIAEKAFKNTLIEATAKHDPIALRSIGNVLNYCGFSSVIGFQFTGVSADALENLKDAPEFQNASKYFTDNLSDSISSFIENKHDIILFDVDRSERSDINIGEDLGALLTQERLLKKYKVLKTIKFFLVRDGEFVPLGEGSSGELTLISTLLYLYSHTPAGSIVIIDEPENSLHPLWQREYISKVLDILYYHQPTIVIATHSPIIVSASKVREDNKNAIPIETFRIDKHTLTKIEDNQSNSSSVEETYWNIFSTVTPVNHFVSETVATLLQKLNEGKTTLVEVKELLQNMSNASYDPLQKRFFDAAERLAIKISKPDDDSEDN